MSRVDKLISQWYNSVLADAFIDFYLMDLVLIPLAVSLVGGGLERYWNGVRAFVSGARTMSRVGGLIFRW